MYVSTRAAVAAGIVAAVAAVIALASSAPAVPLLAGADAVLVLLAIADVATAPGAVSLKLQRYAPATATTGADAAVRITLRNPLRRRLAVWVRDESPSSFNREPLVHRVVLPARAAADLDAVIRPSRRGRIAMGPVVVRTAGRFGLAGRQGTIRLGGEVKVYPPLPGRAQVSLLVERARVLQGGDRATRVRGGAGEFDSLREYHLDDEFRRINWHATARAAKPISNVFREERNQQVLLLLDAGRMMAGNVEGVSRFEWGIDAAVAIAELAASIGDHVGMAAFARDLRGLVPPRGGPSHPSRILDALFALEPSLDAPNYSHVFATLLSRWRRRSLLVLVTELTDPAAMDPLIRALPILLRRHIVIVGSVTDPAVESLALSVPRTSDEVYAKAAASRTLDARERTAARLRGLGAIVVDRPPGRLSGALADRYLHVKEHGRL